MIRAVTFGNRVTSIARVDYSVPGNGDRIDNCALAPNGTCREYFPKTDGPSFGLGVLASVMPRIVVGVDGGFFRTSANRYVALNVSYAWSAHVAALVDWRYINLEYVGDSRVSFRPAQLGVRVF